MASPSQQLVLRIFSPSPLLSVEEKVKDLTNQVNVQLDLITTIFRTLSGEAGDGPIQFDADIDVQNHRLLNVADPETETDGTNRRFVTSLVDGVQEELAEVQDLIHDELPAGGQPFVLQRAVPTVVDNTIEIGAFVLTNDAHTFDLAITVSESSFSVAKAWTLVINRSINSDWQIALPLFDTGAGSSQDFDLDVKQVDADSKVSLRLRRSAGTTAGTATIQILAHGNVADLFTESSATASVTAPTVILESAVLTVRDGHVGINTKTINYVGVGTSLTIEGTVGGDNRAAITLRNPAPGTVSTIGEVRFFGASTTLMLVEAIADGAADAGLFRIRLKATGVEIATALTLTSLNNLILGGGTAAGTSAQKVLVIGAGVAPTTSPVDAFQQYGADVVPGNCAPAFRTENGDVIIIFKGAALTAANASTVDSTYGTEEAAVINNLRVRLGELEARLIAHGLLA